MVKVLLVQLMIYLLEVLRIFNIRKLHMKNSTNPEFNYMFQSQSLSFVCSF